MNVFDNKCEQILSKSYPNLIIGSQMMANPSHESHSSTQISQHLTVISPSITISHRSLPSESSSLKTTISPSINPSTNPVIKQSTNKWLNNNRIGLETDSGVKRIYEGSHIHYSPVDNKPLCSYSTKLCKQRRINGYAFCIRHILEDMSSPFKQCKHVAKYNQQKCSNAIPANEDRLFCNSHMQIAGMAPKKERKDKKSNLINKSVVNDLKFNNNSNDKLLTNDKFTNFNAFIKPSLKLNGITNNNNNYNNNNNQKKVIDKCTTTTNETSISSHLNDCKLNNKKKNIKKTKRKKKEQKNVDKFIFARKKKTGDNLFSYHIWSSSDEEEDDSDIYNYNVNNDCNEDLFPVIFGTLNPRLDELESNELKNELIAQKWLLKNLISIRKKDISVDLEKTRNILSSLNTSNRQSYSYLDYKLEENSKRSLSSIKKGICCYTSDEISCLRPSLPFTRHCIEHILYNVDQLLFSRCTAKCSKTLTQCSRSTFDIIHEEPLCHYHQSVPIETDDRPNSPTTDGKNIKRRKKTKPMALTRVSRRGKKRRKVGKEIPVIEDSIDSKLDDEDSIHEESNDINLLPQKIEVQHNLPIPQTTASSVISLIPPPLMRLPLMPTTTSASVVIDTNVMPPPPPLEPTEEALVASIVADLPQLTNDADFTEVLNKIPDDAFSDFLLEHQNGEPSTEETEALEQALAMVNKDVQNLVAVAGVAAVSGINGNSSQLTDVNVQSEILGFSNWLGSLTTEQRQQLNGLIDGAIASNSLSPILKNACEAYPSTLLPSSAPTIMKSSTTNTNTFPVIYPINQLSIPTTSQEFVPISSTVPILSNNLLMNGLSSHQS